MIPGEVFAHHCPRRVSGPSAEALGAGKEATCVAGQWLGSQQFDDDTFFSTSAWLTLHIGVSCSGSASCIIVYWRNTLSGRCGLDGAVALAPSRQLQSWLRALRAMTGAQDELRRPCAESIAFRCCSLFSIYVCITFQGLRGHQRLACFGKLVRRREVASSGEACLLEN